MRLEKRFVHGALQKQYTFRVLLTASPIGRRRKTIEFLTLLATLGLLEFRREPTIAEDTGGVVAMLESRFRPWT